MVPLLELLERVDIPLPLPSFHWLLYSSILIQWAVPVIELELEYYKQSELWSVSISEYVRRLCGKWEGGDGVVPKFFSKGILLLLQIQKLQYIFIAKTWQVEMLL